MYKNPEYRLNFVENNAHFGEGYLDLINQGVTSMTILCFARIYNEELNGNSEDSQIDLLRLKQKIIFLIDKACEEKFDSLNQLKAMMIILSLVDDKELNDRVSTILIERGKQVVDDLISG